MQPAKKICRACSRVYRAGEVFCPEDGSRLASQRSEDANAPDPLIGSILGGRYHVLRVLGEGGMGRVYEAEHTLIERRVAIKVLREDFCRRADVVERFRREAKSASRIGHPNIVDVIDFGETPAGASYFVMELLSGEDLADVLSRKGALPPERATLIVYQCCHALAVAHDKGIVHRDLKPENVFLIEREGAPDFVKLVDFGVAKMSEVDPDKEPPGKLTRTGVLFGTPEYMSPEQATGLSADHRSDVYALGVTLYEVLTGRVPFEGSSFMSVLSKHANKPVPALRVVHPRIQLSAALERVVMRALEKDRGRRFQHMREMAAALAHVPEMPPLPFRTSLPGLERPSAPAAGTGMPSLPGPVESRRISLPPLRSFAPSRLTLAAFAAVALAAIAAYAASRADSTSLRVSAGPTASDAIEAPPAAPPEREARAERPETHASPPMAAVSQPEVELSLVPIRVTSQPSGARVRVVGGEEVCGSTPCSFDAVAGQPLTLQARRGRSQAVTTITPASETELHMVLENASPEPPRTRAQAAEARATTEHDDLKIPEMFR